MPDRSSGDVQAREARVGVELALERRVRVVAGERERRVREHRDPVGPGLDRRLRRDRVRRRGVRPSRSGRPASSRRCRSGRSRAPRSCRCRPPGRCRSAGVVQSSQSPRSGPGGSSLHSKRRFAPGVELSLPAKRNVADVSSVPAGGPDDDARLGLDRLRRLRVLRAAARCSTGTRSAGTASRSAKSVARTWKRCSPASRSWTIIGLVHSTQPSPSGGVSMSGGSPGFGGSRSGSIGSGSGSGPGRAGTRTPARCSARTARRRAWRPRRGRRTSPRCCRCRPAGTRR